MRPNRRATLAALPALIWPGQALPAQPATSLSLVTGDLPPMTMPGAPGQRGVLLDLVEAMLKQADMLAQPEFFQRAAAMGGAWSIGGTDNGMLERIATIAQDYLVRNYDQAVGGPTGAEE